MPAAHERKRKRKAPTQCFALLESGDTSVTNCRLDPTECIVHIGRDAPATETWLAATLKDGPTTIEVWQTVEFGPDTPVEAVWKIPLLAPSASQLLTYPVIFRTVTDDPEARPTVGKTRKALAAHIRTIRSAPDEPDEDPDEADAVVESQPSPEDDDDDDDEFNDDDFEFGDDDNDDDDADADPDADDDDDDDGDEDDNTDDDDMDDDDLFIPAATRSRRRR